MAVGLLFDVGKFARAGVLTITKGAAEPTPTHAQADADADARRLPLRLGSGSGSVSGYAGAGSDVADSKCALV